MMRPVPAGLGVNRPPMRTASSANQRKNSAPYLTSPMLSATTLPISRVIRVAMSSARSVILSKTARRISPRSRGGVAAHSACTAHAASSAAIASSAVASATAVKTWSSEGSRTLNVDLASRSSPPIQRPVGTDDSSLVVSILHLLHLRPAASSDQPEVALLDIPPVTIIGDPKPDDDQQRPHRHSDPQPRAQRADPLARFVAVEVL